MKILKVKSREYKGKQYYKYRISPIPELLLKQAGFKSGDSVEGLAKKGELRLVKKKV